VDALTNRLGTRFLAVTVIPNALLMGYVGFLFTTGVPTRSPSLARAVMSLNELTIRQIIVIVLGLLIISVATHPLQTPLIQLVEGYWWGLPFGQKVANHFTDRFRNELRWVRSELHRLEGIAQPWDWTTTYSAANARRHRNWLPAREQNLLPTALGNTLRTGEIRAGERYGLELNVALPRLAPLMSTGVLADLRDRRNQLDASVRLCIAAGLATAVGVGLLLGHGPWLFLPLATYLLCWACYRAAVAAARGFCNSLAAAIDLHHLQLFDALQLERPANLAEEIDRNRTLRKLFRGERLDEKTKIGLGYIAPKANEVVPEVDGPAAE
jgi:hypothetical protein